MRFEAHQQFDVPAASVLAAYADPALYEGLGALGKLSAPTLVEHRADDQSVLLRLRYRYVGDLPPGAGRVIRPDKLTWVQETRTDLGSGVSELEIQPDHYPDRLRASGTIRVTAQDSGCTRIVAGELKVRVPLVGGRVEEVIVEGLQEHMAHEAEAVAARLRD